MDRQRHLLKEQEAELLAKEVAIDVEPAAAFCEEDTIPDGHAATYALLGKVKALLAEWNGASEAQGGGSLKGDAPPRKRPSPFNG